MGKQLANMKDARSVQPGLAVDIVFVSSTKINAEVLKAREVANLG